MARIDRITGWLPTRVTPSSGGRYRHQLLVENTTRWNDIRLLLKQYFRLAHADAVQRLRRLAGVSLHPLRADESSRDPARGYPYSFGTTVLKGYFGEVFGFIVAESYAPCGFEDWEVYTFPFIATFMTRQPVSKTINVKRVRQPKRFQQSIAFGRFFDKIFGYHMVNRRFFKLQRLFAPIALHAVVAPYGEAFSDCESALVHASQLLQR
jgi:hypothetical protein